MQCACYIPDFTFNSLYQKSFLQLVRIKLAVEVSVNMSPCQDEEASKPSEDSSSAAAAAAEASSAEATEPVEPDAPAIEADSDKATDATVGDSRDEL